MNGHPAALPPDRLLTPCDPASFWFETTAELADTDIIIGQPRALEAIQLGLKVAQKGFNVFVLGPPGSGKLTAARELAERIAATQPPPSDWCYVNNFANPAQPKALRLPAGWGRHLAHDMEVVVEDLVSALPAAFEGEEYRSRAEKIEQQAREREAEAVNRLRAEALRSRIALIETPTGFAFAPMQRDQDEIISPDQFQNLSDQERQAIETTVADLQQQLQKILRQFPAWRKEARGKLKALNREIAEFTVSHQFADLKARYASLPGVIEYLNLAQADIIEHTESFLPKAEGVISLFEGPQKAPAQRYRINLVVDHSELTAAPVVQEDLPTHGNLIGRIEHQAHMGALVTDFTMIRPGALHKANGGYLLLDARKLLSQPFAWETLKRALHAGEIRIEALERSLSLISTTSLEPEPIPLDLKVILFGERMLYFLLDIYDPEFPEFFKIAADFEEVLPRDADSIELYARMVATLARREKLRPLHREAVARIVEHASRRTGDSEKLSAHLRSLADLMREADFYAGSDGRNLITAADVEHAINRRIYRSDRLRNRVQEAIRRGLIFVDTEGAVAGQINGLSVFQLNDFAFGQPSRITATTRPGSGRILDIEKETELGGALHSKGVLILGNFLASRYSGAQGFSVAASLVFEQSYGGVDGDSASLAELCAVLSSIAEVPIRQNLAITGSVDQHGRVQPIGGVNEKIEGFFDVCAARGLTGDHGVIIPAANVVHLMLRRDVVQAAAEGKFHVYAVSQVDEALELLTGIPVGRRDETGVFPEGSLNRKVEERLKDFAAVLRSLQKSGEETGGEKH
ncbi:Lon protease family protein [Methylococcus capsulatus]|uniref:Lon protease family protein n=1 Tax=Methylococcus capsulatus TaxID=414 RepID=UPI002017DF76|nr:ATP-binding protein [Methylococcus capsulatus]UQN13416.1 AAA family ATPase [Methylococcus capsulatus]